MVLCKKCGRDIEETMEGIYGGECVECISKGLAEAEIEIGTLESMGPKDFYEVIDFSPE